MRGIGAIEMIAVEGWMHPVRSGLPWVAILNGPGGAATGCDYHIGDDYHKAYSHIVVQDTGGKTLRSGRVRKETSPGKSAPNAGANSLAFFHWGAP